MTEILFSGCSFTKGVGLALEDKDPNNACNVFAQECFADNYHCTNVSRGGYSNLSIYFATATGLLKKQYDYAFVSRPRVTSGIWADVGAGIQTQTWVISRLYYLFVTKR